MEVAILRHQYDLIDLAVHFIRRKRIGKRTCPSKTMDRKATTVWPLRPASGGAPKRGSKILQERHAYAHRDIRWAASQSGFQDHQTTHVVQGAPGAWPEAFPTNFASPCLWGKYSTMKYAWRVPTIPGYSPSEKFAKPSSMSTCLRWWPAPPLLRDSVQYPTSSSRNGTSRILRCTKWEVHCLQVLSKDWFPTLQLEGILLCCTYGPCRRGLQVHLGGPR